MNSKYSLHYFFIFDGGIVLCKFEVSNTSDKSNKSKKEKQLENEKRSYEYLKVVRRIPTMNIVSALDSCDE